MLSKYSLLFFFSVSVCFTSYATQSSTDLYTAVVSVPSAEATERTLAVKQAFNQVLVKLSGNRTLLDNPKVKTALDDAEQFVEQFEYQTRPHDGQLLLVVGFEAEAVKQLLQKLGISAWQSTRPTLLAWIILDKETTQHVINLITQSVEANKLHVAATARGFPLLFPILDLEDLRTLSVTDVMIGRRETIAQIAHRYGVKTTWVGRIAQQEDTWIGQWHLLIGDKQWSWQTEASSLDTLLIQGLDEAIDKVVKRTTIDEPIGNANSVQTTTETFILTIYALPNLNDYAKVRDYLQGVEVVSRLRVQKVQPGQATFSITVQGGKTALSQALSLGHLLTPETSTDTEVIYRFTGSPW